MNVELRELLALSGGAVTRAAACEVVSIRALQRACRCGEVRRLLPGVYVDELTKVEWIIALGEMGPRAREARPQLQHEWFHAQHYWVHKRIEDTLTKIDPDKFPLE